jgi:hypothetical protein
MGTWLAQNKPATLMQPELQPATKPLPKPPAATRSKEIEHINLGNDALGPLTEPFEKKIRAKFKAQQHRPTPVAPDLALLDPPTILDLHEPAYVRKTKPAARGYWVIGNLLMFLLLTGQLLLHFRTELISSAPKTRPAFAKVCKILGCQIVLPHEISQIIIETSNLVPDDKHAGVMWLSAQLHNRAQQAVAWPHLEVTLTDAQEHPLLRRVLSPAEFLPAGSGPDKGFPAHSEQFVQLTLMTDVPAVGYRLYIFYP